MNILILNLPGPVLKAGSRWYNKDKAKTRKNILRYYPYPWFMGYATALLKKHGFEVTFKDAIALEWNENQARNYINSLKPEYIICEPTWVSLDDDVKFLNSLDLNAVRIAVGNCATNFPYLCIEKGFDYAVVGEYEFSLLEFFKNEGKQLPVNFVSRQKKQYAYYPLVENLDLFPFPERDDTPIEYYNEPSCYGRNVVMVSSRGCRLKCNFCNVECIYGRHIYRTRSPQNVVDEMEWIKENMPEVKEIFVEDDTMTVDKNRMLEICKLIKERKLDIVWSTNARTDIPLHVLKEMKEAGCRMLIVGYESGNQQILNNIKKGITLEQAEQFTRDAKAVGIKIFGCFMIGLPGDTKETIRQTIKWAKHLKPDMIQIEQIVPFPGTEFYEWAKAKGYVKTEDPDAWLDETGQLGFLIDYPHLSAEELKKMRDKLTLEFYTDPRQMIRILLNNLHPSEFIRLTKASIDYFTYLLKKKVWAQRR